jgi:hypothetical protein
MFSIFILKHIGLFLKIVSGQTKSFLSKADIRRKGMRLHVLFPHGHTLGRIQTALQLQLNADHLSRYGQSPGRKFFKMIPEGYDG